MPELPRPSDLCDGVRVLFTGRDGGVSTGAFSSLNLGGNVGDDPVAVARNRFLVQRAIGPRPSHLAFMHQVHGTGVLRVDGPAQSGPAQSGPERTGSAQSGSAQSGPERTGSEGISPERPGRERTSHERASVVPPQPADAAYTASADVAIAALGADCAPVLVADPVARLVGAAHAGRPGMAAGVVPALVEAMVRAGAEPSRMHAVIGPSICGRCYEVPARMRDEVAEVVPESACVTRQGTPAIDLRAGLRAQLTRLGFAAVSDDPRCTAETPELFSYRRDGTTGRFGGLIWLAS